MQQSTDAADGTVLTEGCQVADGLFALVVFLPSEDENGIRRICVHSAVLWWTLNPNTPDYLTFLTVKLCIFGSQSHQSCLALVVLEENLESIISHHQKQKKSLVKLKNVFKFVFLPCILLQSSCEDFLSVCSTTYCILRTAITYLNIFISTLWWLGVGLNKIVSIPMLVLWWFFHNTYRWYVHLSIPCPTQVVRVNYVKHTSFLIFNAVLHRHISNTPFL